MNNSVSLKLAKLLFKKEFNGKFNVYIPINEPNKSSYKFTEEDWKSLEYADRPIQMSYDHFTFIPAPTIADVVMWLYEQGIWVYSKRGCKIVSNEAFDVFTAVVEFIPQTNFDVDDIGDFDSPIEAYEAAIEYCLDKHLK